jgi:hypothetical protein
MNGGPPLDAAPGTDRRDATARPDAATGRPTAPVSPFASFRDTEAAIDHVYREIERRRRIERERRGL